MREMDEPGVNWLVSVLANDVGRVEWVRMTPEEQAIYDIERPHNKGYPYKVVEHPIKPGKKIVLKCDGKTVIDCDSEKTRELLIQTAIQYIETEKQRDYFRQELGTDRWIPVEQIPPHSPCSSFLERGRRYIVYSPTLRYVNGGVTEGFRDKGEWYIRIRGKEIKHKITHCRPWPPGLPDNTEYEEVKEEAGRINAILKDNNGT